MTLEEFAKQETSFPRKCYPNLAMECIARNNIIKGGKFQEEKILTEVDKYVKFVILCDRDNLPIISFNDWNEQLNNK